MTYKFNPRLGFRTSVAGVRTLTPCRPMRAAVFVERPRQKDGRPMEPVEVQVRKILVDQAVNA